MTAAEGAMEGLGCLLNTLVVIGSYTETLDFVNGTGVGVYSLPFASNCGKFAPSAALKVQPVIPNPSYGCALEIGAEHLLYYVQEFVPSAETPVGSSTVTAYKLGKDGLLSRINSVETGGFASCFVVPDKFHKRLIIANYMSGSVTLVSLDEETGGVGKVDFILGHDKGSHVVPRRQESAHPHMIVVKDDYVFVTDLGADAIYQYKYDLDSGLVPNPLASHVNLPPGSGPRHMVFHPTQNKAYVVSEMASTVAVCDYDALTGTLKVGSLLSTLPEGMEEKANNASAIRITKDGKYLYAGNRGHDSIAGFQVHASGELTSIGHFKVGGHTPRDFNLDPSERYVLVANQDSNLITVLERNHKNGKLELTEAKAKVPSPNSILFVPIDHSLYVKE